MYRKFLKLGIPVVKYFFFAFTAIVMIFTVVSVTTFDNQKGNGLFGYKFFIVLSDSMKSEFNVGDIAVSKKVDASTLKAGDIVSFISIDPANYGECVTHKIRSKTIENGKPAFITYGTTTEADDSYPALEENIIGKYSFSVPKAGYVFDFLKRPIGYFCLVFIPFFILIVLEGMRFFSLAKAYRKEQQEKIEAQKADLKNQQDETQRMLKELEDLKAKLEEKGE